MGIVVDTADPQQMGRLRVQCPALGDRDNTPINDLPWARYASPFGGDVQVGTRGPDQTNISGPTAYGMWAIPKIGAQVLVMCIDGVPANRVWIGCVYTQHTPHTMPHGRFSYDDQKAGSGDQKPAGPYDSFENSIQPLYSNLQEAFGQPSEGSLNFEFASRAADFQASGVQQNQIPNSLSLFSDDADQSSGFPGNLETVRQGYRTSQIDPEDIIIEDSNTQVDDRGPTTKPNYDNMVTSIVSAGFHAISMDDRAENSRMRFRTAAGHQVIMDDTNERVYISTAKGNNWIEIDQEGNIDIYTSGKLSATAEKDINFNTSGSFRVNAERGIHMRSGKEMRVTTEEDISIDTRTNIRAKAQRSVRIEAAEQDISLKARRQVFAEATNNNINMRAGGDILTNAEGVSSHGARGAFIIGGASVDIGGSSSVTVSASRIDLNGPSADDPLDALTALAAETDTGDNPRLAFYPNRTPQHEPWARIDNNDEGEQLRAYNSSDVGILRFSTGDDGTTSEQETITRGPLWRR